MLHHLLPPVGLRQILNGGEEIFVLLNPVLYRLLLIIRQSVDAGLHGGVRSGEPMRECVRRRTAGICPGGMPGRPVTDGIENQQHGQKHPPFVTLEELECFHRFTEACPGFDTPDVKMMCGRRRKNVKER